MSGTRRLGPACHPAIDKDKWGLRTKLIEAPEWPCPCEFLTSPDAAAARGAWFLSQDSRVIVPCLAGVPDAGMRLGMRVVDALTLPIML